MSNRRRNFVIAYISLVGIPLLCLAGVLRAGRHLAAPISINGAWKIGTDVETLGTSPCRGVIASLAGSPLLISQSGKALVLTFNDGGSPTALGSIDGNRISASAPAPGNPSAAACSLEHLIVTATVDSRTEPKSLSGNLSLNGCSACLPLEFKAVRQPRGGEPVR
jgi:hypothetical protein